MCYVLCVSTVYFRCGALQTARTLLPTAVQATRSLDALAAQPLRTFHHARVRCFDWRLACFRCCLSSCTCVFVFVCVLCVMLCAVCCVCAVCVLCVCAVFVLCVVVACSGSCATCSSSPSICTSCVAGTFKNGTTCRSTLILTHTHTHARTHTPRSFTHSCVCVL